MKYTRRAVSAALCSISMVKGRELASIVSRSVLSSSAPKHRLDKKTDVGILVQAPYFVPGLLAEHSGRNLELYSCPSTCKDDVLCNCIRAYYNSDEDESCTTKISSACKANELLPCYPLAKNESDSKYAGYSKANANYFQCPRFECFETLGLAGNLQKNMTAYYSCVCKAWSNMCEKCEEMKDEVPYCQTWLSNLDSCPDFINCCETETSIDGFTKCFNLIKASVIEYEQGNTSSLSNTSVGTEDVSNGPYACPNTCKDNALCNCIRLYYNSDEEESCTTKISSACKANEFLPCYPLKQNESDPKYAGYSKAYANYVYCPKYECFEASGLAGNLTKNMTAYNSCICKAYSNMCEKCEEMKDEVPYCQTWLATYGNACPDFINCCETETSKGGLTKCFNLFAASAIENEEHEAPDPSSLTTESSVSDIVASIKQDQESQHETVDSGWDRVGSSSLAVLFIMTLAYLGFE